MTVCMRDARWSDLSEILRWRNEPGTYANFHNRYPLSLPAMQRWLSDALADPRTTLWMAEREDKLVGVLRVDPDGAVMIIVAPEARGQGVAGSMLAHLPDRPLFAEIRETNTASHAAFATAGFCRAGSRCGMLVYRREKADEERARDLATRVMPARAVKARS